MFRMFNDYDTLNKGRKHIVQINHENKNIPTVGKVQVHNDTKLSWIRCNVCKAINFKSRYYWQWPASWKSILLASLKSSFVSEPYEAQRALRNKWRLGTEC